MTVGPQRSSPWRSPAPWRSPGPRPSPSRGDRGGRWRRAALGAAGLAAVVLVAQVLPATGAVSAEHLPPPSEVARALAAEVTGPEFWTALRSTLTAWAVGLAIAVTAGVSVGVLIGSVPVLAALTSSTIEFLRPIPSVALIPVAVLMYGSTLRSSLLLVVYACFWQVVIQVLHGVRDVDPVAEQTARSYGLGPLARMRHVTWPTALPYALTGVRLAAAVALVLAVTAELVIGVPGLGQRINVAQSSGAEPLMYALVVVAGLLGVAINFAARAAERRLLSWHQSTRTEVLA